MWWKRHEKQICTNLYIFYIIIIIIKSFQLTIYCCQFCGMWRFFYSLFEANAIDDNFAVPIIMLIIMVIMEAMRHCHVKPETSKRHNCLQRSHVRMERALFFVRIEIHSVDCCYFILSRDNPLIVTTYLYMHIRIMCTQNIFCLRAPRNKNLIHMNINIILK